MSINVYDLTKLLRGEGVSINVYDWTKQQPSAAGGVETPAVVFPATEHGPYGVGGGCPPGYIDIGGLCAFNIVQSIAESAPSPIFGGQCPPGQHLGMPPCPEGSVCQQSLQCVLDEGGAPPSLLDPIKGLLPPSLGGGGAGGVGRALPIGTAGTRLVAQSKANPMLTILILVAIGGIGYFVYKRYIKKGA